MTRHRVWYWPRCCVATASVARRHGGGVFIPGFPQTKQREIDKLRDGRVCHAEERSSIAHVPRGQPSTQHASCLEAVREGVHHRHVTAAHACFVPVLYVMAHTTRRRRSWAALSSGSSGGVPRASSGSAARASDKSVCGDGRRLNSRKRRKALLVQCVAACRAVCVKACAAARCRCLSCRGCASVVCLVRWAAAPAGTIQSTTERVACTQLSHRRRRWQRTGSFAQHGVPRDVVSSILSFLPAADMARCGATCHAMQDMCRDGELWKLHYTRDFRRVIPDVRRQPQSACVGSAGA